MSDAPSPSDFDATAAGSFSAFGGSPSEIFDFLRGAVTQAATWQNLWVTLQETIEGFALATALGVLTGLLFTRVPILHEIARPYLTALNSLPRIALAPLFTLWFGLGQRSKVALVVSLCFFIVLSSTMGAIENVDPDLVRLHGDDLILGPDKLHQIVPRRHGP